MVSLYQRFREWQRSPEAGGNARERAPGNVPQTAEPEVDWLSRRAFDASPGARFVAEIGGRVLLSNNAFRQLCGLSAASEAASIDLTNLFREPNTWTSTALALSRGQRRDFQSLELQRMDGSAVEVIASFWLDPAANGAHGHVHGNLIDPAARTQLETALGATARLEYVTKFAGEVAHDFNNLLTIILSVGELMLLSRELSANLARRARNIVSAGQRAATLSAQLLALSRARSVEPSPLRTNALLETALLLLRRLMPDVEVQVQLAPDAGVIRADAAQLEQVLVRLVILVRDAMAKGAAVWATSQRVELSEGDVQRYRGLRPGTYARIALRDSEAGEANPYGPAPDFVVSDPAKSSGLGLSAAHSVVMRCGGRLEVERPQAGAPKFDLFFPLIEANAPAFSSASTCEPVTTTFDQRAYTIMVVDDEEMVRQLTSLMLRELGYTVIEAPHGLVALTLARQYPGPIDLLVTDVVMPDMGGVELARQMRLVRPGIEVLYMSGHTEDRLLREGVAKGEVRLLQKPFTRLALERAVREQLAATHTIHA